jgi:peptidoglycan hydrolase-like protein with peptidoglycan-binding domain
MAGAVGVVVVAVGAGAAGVAGAFSRPAHSSARDEYPTSTAVVSRRTLTSQDQVDATLEDSGSYTVVNQAAGTLTWLPAVGDVVREGGVLYRVDGAPVVLLYGHVPAYRSLAEGMTGADVRELNHALVALRYAVAADIAALGWDYFGWETKAALQEFQTALGLSKITGTLGLGQAVFLPAAVKVTALESGVVPGASAPPGSALLTASSDTPVVDISLDADQQTEVKDGDKVTVTLPDDATTPGVVSYVGTVASTNASGSTTITVDVTLDHPGAAGDLDQAPVEVAITTGAVSDALVVPVDALLARPSGGYAVEVTGPRGHRLVAVSVGLFDDAAGLVQVSGSGLAVGQHVVVPTI